MAKKERELLHPILNVPAVAVVVRHWMINGRYAGEVLRFPDGHTASLTFAEIAEAQEALTVVAYG